MSAEQVYTPTEVEAVLEAAVAKAEADVEQLLAEEAQAEEVSEEVAEEIAEEIAEEVAEEVAEEIAEEEALEDAVAQVTKEFAAEEDGDSEDEDEDEYDDDDFDPNDETLMDRIEALKDIFTPDQRGFFTSAYFNIINCSKSATLKFGSTLWYAATTAMLIGVPLAVAILNETQLTELEKELNGAGLGAPAAAPTPAAAEEAK